jgi:hypothetical protein
MKETPVQRDKKEILKLLKKLKDEGPLNWNNIDCHGQYVYIAAEEHLVYIDRSKSIETIHIERKGLEQLENPKWSW